MQQRVVDLGKLAKVIKIILFSVVIILTPHGSRLARGMNLIQRIAHLMDREEKCPHHIQLSYVSLKEKRQIWNARKKVLKTTYFNISSKGYKVVKKEASICIIMPYAEKLIEQFYAPLFIDGTACIEAKTIIHISCVTTTNVIIVVGLIMCSKEAPTYVNKLLKMIVTNKPLIVMSDEGVV